MRVTKAIREFIEEQVRIKANQSQTITELKQRANEVQENFNAEKEKIEEERCKAIKELAKKYNIESHRPVSDYNLPEVVAYNNARSKLLEKCRLTVLNIIAEMELGGTKAELMDKLNNLTF